MNKEEIIQLERKFRDAPPEEIINLAVNNYGDSLAFATSLAWEDQAVTFLLLHITRNIEIFTLDTGRLFQETYDTIDRTNKFFETTIRIVVPDTQEVEKMVNRKGINLFYDSVENRKECCHIRKTLPLQKVLVEKKAWITGLRREQSVTRYGLKKIEYDEKSGLVKFNPIADWTEEQTIKFVKNNNIPYNQLQSMGYRSIGCLPCTRPVTEKDDVRAGRWWWEQPENKECGLHK
jgi:phosphoadenosine phosphosulfate reductase